MWVYLGGGGFLWSGALRSLEFELRVQGLSLIGLRV